MASDQSRRIIEAAQAAYEVSGERLDVGLTKYDLEAIENALMLAEDCVKYLETGEMSEWMAHNWRNPDHDHTVAILIDQELKQMAEFVSDYLALGPATAKEIAAAYADQVATSQEEFEQIKEAAVAQVEYYLA